MNFATLLFLSTLGVVSVKTIRIQFSVDYKLMYVTVLRSTNGLFLILRLFNFFIFEHNCVLYEFNFCFLVELLHYSHKQLKESIVGKMHSAGRRRIRIFNGFSYIVYAFCAETKLSSKILWFFLFLPMLVFLLVVIRYITNNDGS